MMQNKLSFHQSSDSLEIIGLPDYSNNENKDQISIISQWKLTIIDKPLIERKIEHLWPIMNAFYLYSKLLIKASNSSNLILFLTKDFLNGLLFLNFQIETLFGKTSFNLSLFDREYRDCKPFKSIVSKINNNKSSFSIVCLDT